jgi:hypothetical protein
MEMRHFLIVLALNLTVFGLSYSHAMTAADLETKVVTSILMDKETAHKNIGVYQKILRNMNRAVQKNDADSLRSQLSDLSARLDRQLPPLVTIDRCATISDKCEKISNWFKTTNALAANPSKNAAALKAQLNAAMIESNTVKASIQ